MTTQKRQKLNQLERDLPEGLLVTAAWLGRKGYSTSLRAQYVAAGWLEQPTRGVYMRSLKTLRWEQVIISLQTLLEFPVVVGGRTALELQGYAHFLTQHQSVVHLYGTRSLPAWMHKLPLPVRFVHHNSSRLFHNDPITRSLTALSWNVRTQQSVSTDPLRTSLTIQPWGQWSWPLTLSTAERAALEILDELPGRESFDQVDKLMEGLANLSPRRLNKLLLDCKSIKVKRLFFFFADRHEHTWLKRVDRHNVDLGKGKRMLVRGGKLDPTYQITIPEDFDGVRRDI